MIKGKDLEYHHHDDIVSNHPLGPHQSSSVPTTSKINNNTVPQVAEKDQAAADEESYQRDKDVLRRWLEMILGLQLQPSDNQWLELLCKNGKLLCTLLIRIYVALRMHKQALSVTIDPENAIENFQMFLTGVITLEVSTSDCCSIEDLLHPLYSTQSERKVVWMLMQLNSTVMQHASKAKTPNRLLHLQQQLAVGYHNDDDAIITDEQCSSFDWKTLLDQYENLLRRQERDNEEEVEYMIYSKVTEIQSKLHSSGTSSSTEKVPHARLWMLLSGAFTELQIRPLGYYQSLHEQTNESSITDAAMRQIEADLPRTINSNDKVDLISLKRVLVALARHKPMLGYCQGLNFIAARLLQAVEEEWAFWLLVKLVENTVPDDYYSNMFGVAVDQRVFTDLLRVTHPEISAHSQHVGSSGQELSLMSTEWFLTIFASPFKKELTFKIWDIVFTSSSSTILFQAGLAILGHYSSQILQCSTLGDILVLLNSIGHGTEDLNDSIDLWKNPITSPVLIENLRAYHRLLLSSKLLVAQPHCWTLHNTGPGDSVLPPNAVADGSSNSTTDLEILLVTDDDDHCTYAYYFDGTCPVINSEHWTSKSVSTAWQVSSKLITEEQQHNSSSCVASSLEERTTLEARKHLSLRKKISEWQREKKAERLLKEATRKKIRDQKRALKIQRALEKQRRRSEKARTIRRGSVPTSNHHSLKEIAAESAEPGVCDILSFHRTWSAPSLKLHQNTETTLEEAREHSGRMLKERAKVVLFLRQSIHEAPPRDDNGDNDQLLDSLFLASPKIKKNTTRQKKQQQQKSVLPSYNTEPTSSSFLERLSTDLEAKFSL